MHLLQENEPGKEKSNLNLLLTYVPILIKTGLETSTKILSVVANAKDFPFKQ